MLADILKSHRMMLHWNILRKTIQASIQVIQKRKYTTVLLFNRDTIYLATGFIWEKQEQLRKLV